MKHPEVGLVGCGRVGTALALALDRHPSLRPVGLVSRSRRSASSLAVRLRSGRSFGDAGSLAAATDRILICVPDAEIPTVVTDLLQAGPLAGKTVLHTSGATGREALSLLARRGASTGLLHPLAAFPPARRRRPLPAGLWFAVDGDTRARKLARDLALRLEGQPFNVPDRSRSAYHLAATLVANHSTVLAALAFEAMERQGLTGTRRMRKPFATLLRSVADRLEEEGPAEGLTGPASRGDMETIRRHLGLLRGGSAQTARLYRLLSDQAARIAEERGDLSRARASALRRLVAQPRRRRR